MVQYYIIEHGETKTGFSNLELIIPTYMTSISFEYDRVNNNLLELTKLEDLLAPECESFIELNKELFPDDSMNSCKDRSIQDRGSCTVQLVMNLIEDNKLNY